MQNAQQDVIAFLSDPASYGLNGGEIERHETHGAIVFLAGDCAWKLKRAVRYPYMDYSTIDARKQMCERELAVNRRTASELYLSVRPIVRNENGKLEFGSENDTRDAEDWVVVMRRFEQADLLANMLRRDKFTPVLMRELAEVIADFHGEAEATPAFGGSASMSAAIDENAALLRKLCPESFRARIDLFNECNTTALERLTPLLDRRRDKGLVRRCHGDLHLNNICLIAGRPVLFDAIEFNDSFACIDVLYDLAFPLMDLMRHGREAHANALLNRYLERTQDYRGLAALPFFLACRAGISAHVTVSRGQEVSSADAIEISQSEFRAFVEFGITCLKRAAPCLVAVGGVSGTGKSTLGYNLAPRLAPAPGAIVLRSDIIRKTMINVSETERLPANAYTDEMHERVYSMLGDQAASILSDGYSVIA
jgi:aminoglycoside phosphotransferase family enzyme